jgi:hypothetical protein
MRPLRSFMLGKVGVSGANMALTSFYSSPCFFSMAQ